MGGKIRVVPTLKGLKHQAKLTELNSVLNGEPEQTLTFVGHTEICRATHGDHISKINM